MAIKDLNNPLDFAKATLSSVAGIVSDFAGRDPSQWDILEGSYNGVLFHVFQSKEVYSGALSQVADSGGRRKVKYQFPYRDGQTTDDLGAKPESFEMDVLIHGTRYMQGFNKLLKELQKPTPGDLIHPVRGSLKVVPEEWTITHSSTTRQAVALRLVFVEHNFSVGEFRTIDDKSVKGALVRALEAFARIERAILNVQGAIIFVNNIKTKIAAALEAYKLGYGDSLSRMNRTFNKGTSVDIPTLLPSNQGGVSDGGNFPTVASPGDPFADVPETVSTSETTAAQAVAEITKEVNQLRKDVELIIEDMSQGEGSLEFYDDIIALKETAVFLQDVLEKGIASSQSRIVEYVTPRIMSLREVAFENGIPVDRTDELDLLNPSLLSINYIAKGTSLKVPVS